MFTVPLSNNIKLRKCLLTTNGKFWNWRTLVWTYTYKYTSPVQIGFLYDISTASIQTSVCHLISVIIPWLLPHLIFPLISSFYFCIPLLFSTHPNLPHSPIFRHHVPKLALTSATYCPYPFHITPPYYPILPHITPLRPASPHIAPHCPTSASRWRLVAGTGRKDPLATTDLLSTSDPLHTTIQDQREYYSQCNAVCCVSTEDVQGKYFAALPTVQYFVSFVWIVDAYFES